MLDKRKNKLLSILPLALIALIIVLTAVNIGLMAGSGTSTAPPVAPPSPPPLAACAHEKTTASVTLAPTCTDEGVISHKCDYCHTVVSVEPVEPIGHDYTDAETTGLCKTCNTKICTRGLTYELSSDETYYIVSKKNPIADGSDLVDLVIPEYHNGKPVKEIASDAFVEQKYIKSVSIPSTMKYIGVGAFSTTEMLKLYYNAENCDDFVGKNWVFYLGADAPSIDVTVGKAVRHIPDRLFFPNNSTPDVMPKIKSVTFEAGSHLESIGEYSFYKAGVKNIVFPDTLKSISAHAFEASALETVKFGGGLAEIGADAFASCADLAAIDLSDTSLKDLSPNAFKNCASAVDVKLPGSTEKIGAKAFFGCTSLETLALDGAVEIGDDAFFGCTSLSKITLPATLKRIGVRAFEGCTALAEIVFSATEMQGLDAGNRAFFGAGAEGGVTVVIADGVKYIPARLFYSTADATKDIHIKSLKIAKSVTGIGDYAFRGTVIDNVIFVGSADEYSRLTIGAGNTELGTPVFGEGV